MLYDHTQYVNIFVYILIVICYCYFIWWSPFIPSRNLDEVFNYNHMALMSYPLLYQGIHGFNDSRSFMYTLLYTIISKYYFKTYFNGPDEARTRVILPKCLLTQLSQTTSYVYVCIHTNTHTYTHSYIYIYIYIYIYNYILYSYNNNDNIY